MKPRLSPRLIVTLCFALGTNFTAAQEVSPVWKEFYSVEDADLGLDSDGDGLLGREEAEFGTDPYSADSVPLAKIRTDGLGLFFDWSSPAGISVQPEGSADLKSWFPFGNSEVGNGSVISRPIDPLSSAKFLRLRALPASDSDSDGLDDFEEYLLGTNPSENDTDGDGDSDGEEALVLLTDPLVAVKAPGISEIPSSVSSSTLNISGTAAPGERVTVIGGENPITTTAGADGTFGSSVALQANRLNRLSFSSENAAGQTGPIRTVEVIQDSQPPTLHIDFPGNNSQLYTTTATIAGRVGDSLSGYEGLDVEVNNLSANVIVGIGTNGTYERPAVPLVVGENLITVKASDVHGNTTTKTILVYRADPGAGSITAVAGNGQTGTVQRRLTTPVEVEVRDSSGQPSAGKAVTFTVIRSDGRLAPALGHPTAGELVFDTVTDASGRARAWWVLGTDAGCGNNRIEVTTEDIPGAAYFCAGANPGPAAQINIGSGNTQTAEVGSFPLQPLQAWVSDSCNGVEGVDVTFAVTSGGGLVNGQSSVTVPTSRTGHAQVDFQLGGFSGNHTVEANFPGHSGSPAVFALRGIERNAGAATTFTAIAQDNAGQPIGGATAYIKVDGQFVGPVSSSADGVVTFPDLPGGGAAELLIDARSATLVGGKATPTGTFPALNFNMVVVQNAANSHPGPVLFPKLDPDNGVAYDGTHDVMLKCKGIEGLEFIVRADSMTLADGTKPGAASPQTLSLNQVHHDDVPMSMPDGAAPPFAWTFQPAGATFDPPVEIRYPNMTGLPPGAIAYFLTYDHAVEKFDIVSSGHVTDDGAHVMSDPGSGLTLSGWGCNCPPYSVTGEAGNLWLDLLTDSNNDGKIDEADEEVEEQNGSMDMMGVHISQDIRFDPKWDENLGNQEDASDKLEAWVPIKVKLCETVSLDDYEITFFASGDDGDCVELWREEPKNGTSASNQITLGEPINDLFGSEREIEIYALGKETSKKWGGTSIRSELTGSDTNGDPLPSSPIVSDEITSTVTRCVVKPYVWRPYLYGLNGSTTRSVFQMRFDSFENMFEDFCMGLVYIDPMEDAEYHGIAAWMGHAFLQLRYSGPEIDEFRREPPNMSTREAHSRWNEENQESERWSGQTSDDKEDIWQNVLAYLTEVDATYTWLQNGSVWWRVNEGKEDDEDKRKQLVNNNYFKSGYKLTTEAGNRIKPVTSIEWRIHPDTLFALSQRIDSHDFDNYVLDMSFGRGCGSYVGDLLYQVKLVKTQDQSVGFQSFNDTPKVRLEGWPILASFLNKFDDSDRQPMREMCFGLEGDGGLNAEFKAKFSSANTMILRLYDPGKMAIWMDNLIENDEGVRLHRVPLK